MRIYYVCDNEGPALMELDDLIDNFNMSEAQVDCDDMRFTVENRGWHKGIHENGEFLVLHLDMLKLTLTPEAWDDPMIYPAGNRKTVSSIQCPHCRLGFHPAVLDQHIREKHT